MIDHPLHGDLREIQERVGDDWKRLRESCIFMTGATGFFGRWLLESVFHANRELGLDVRVVLLTRDREGFRRRAPRLAADPALVILEGDIRNPWTSWNADASDVDFVVHAATDADAALNEADPEAMIATIVDGTRHALEFAITRKAKRFLLTSSGAVYGKQPPEISHVGEEWTGGPSLDDPRSAYAEGKRLAELSCLLAYRTRGIETVISRCFAFLGPQLPLDRHYAAGNFLGDALAGRPIRIQGDGTPIRSYLYPSELAIWLWTILLRGAPGRAYNVGSENAISIEELAREIASHFEPRPSVEIAREPAQDKLPGRYVPSTARARSELGLSQEIGLSDAIARTVAWHRGRGTEA